MKILIPTFLALASSSAALAAGPCYFSESILFPFGRKDSVQHLTNEVELYDGKLYITEDTTRRGTNPPTRVKSTILSELSAPEYSDILQKIETDCPDLKRDLEAKGVKFPVETLEDCG